MGVDEERQADDAGLNHQALEGAVGILAGRREGNVGKKGARCCPHTAARSCSWRLYCRCRKCRIFAVRGRHPRSPNVIAWSSALRTPSMAQQQPFEFEERGRERLGPGLLRTMRDVVWLGLGPCISSAGEEGGCLFDVDIDLLGGCYVILLDNKGVSPTPSPAFLSIGFPPPLRCGRK